MFIYLYIYIYIHIYITFLVCLFFSFQEGGASPEELQGLSLRTEDDDDSSPRQQHKLRSTP